MKIIKLLASLAFFLLISACAAASTNSSQTAVFSPTPTLTYFSKYGELSGAAGKWLFFSDNSDPGVLTQTNLDLSGPFTFGADIPGMKWFHSISPDGKWIVFYTTFTKKGDSGLRNNVYVINSTGTVLNNEAASIIPYMPSYNHANWDSTGTREVTLCTDPENPDFTDRRLCVLTIDGDNINWAYIDKEILGDYAVSPDQTRVLYHNKAVYGNSYDYCLNMLEFSTLQVTRLYCRPEITVVYFRFLGNNHKISLYLAGRGKSLFATYDTATKEMKINQSLGGHTPQLAISPENDKLAMCVSQGETDPPFLYLYEIANDRLLTIKDTSLIYTDTWTCPYGTLRWVNESTVQFETNYKRDKTHYYRLDFEHGTISE